MISDIRLAPCEQYSNLKVAANNQKSTLNKDFKEFINLNSKENIQNEKNNKPAYSFGAPAGFFADVSMLNDEDIKSIGLISN